MSAAHDPARRPAPGGGLRPWRRAAAAALLVAASLGPARAARAQKVEIGTVGLDRLLDLSVESVSRREELASDAPAAVFVLTAEDIRSQGFRTVGEALRSVPGLFTYLDGHWSSLGVRGVGLLADYSTRVLFLVDGHPLNNSVGIGESYLGRDLPLPIGAVKRIEVIKGPVGGVYGPTAFLGVVNLVTEEPGSRKLAARALGEAAQGSVTGGEVEAVAGRGDERWSGIVSAAVHGSAGQDVWFPEWSLFPGPDPVPGNVVSGVDVSSAAHAYARGAIGGVDLAGACGHFRRRLPSAPYESLVGDERTTLSTLTCFAQASTVRRLSESWSAGGRVAYDDFEYRDAYAYDPPPASWGLFRDRAYDRWVTAEVRADWSRGASARASAGLTAEAHWTHQEAYSDDLPSLEEDPVNGVGVGPIPKDYRTLNAWALGEVQILASLRLQAGATFYVHQIFGSRLTPKVAAVWRPTPADVVKVLYAEGFRAPTAAEAFYEDGTDFAANPDLGPELVRSAEVVVERRVGDVLSLSASGFWNDYRDLIQFQTVPWAGGGTRQVPFNVGSLAVAGLEASAVLRWGDLLQAWGGLSVQRVVEGDAPNFPALTASVALSTRRPWRPLRLSLNVAATSARDKDATALVAGQRERLPATAVVGAAATLDVPGASGLSVELGVSNLLDARVLHPVAGDFSPVSEMPEPARTVRLGVRWAR